ncbi:hypothetical protein BDZ97DRAFT_2054615 [Flammula alnicola]|nr:hypothetical protein BDZ97DRAFT_2054615 [Flammula alnicola]
MDAIPTSDTKVQSIDGSEITLELSQVSPQEESRLRRIFDINLLPPLAFMYLCNALDKGNVGNAKTDGWDKDIHLTGNQYYLLVMIFYLRDSDIFIGQEILRGACFTLDDDRLQIFAIRFFLGIFESAMLPGVVFYLSTFYKRNELASRVGLFYGSVIFNPLNRDQRFLTSYIAASSISGAFSGKQESPFMLDSWNTD